MKLILAQVFVTLLSVYSVTGTSAGPIALEDAADRFRDSPTKVVQDFTQARPRRSPQVSNAVLDSWKIIRQLVKDARHVYSDGKITVYRKKGSYTEALEDFYSAGPYKVRDLLSFTYVREASGDVAQLHKMGITGRRRIYIGTEMLDGSPVIAFSKINHPGSMDKLIIYRK